MSTFMIGSNLQSYVDDYPIKENFASQAYVVYKNYLLSFTRIDLFCNSCDVVENYKVYSAFHPSKVGK